MSWLARILWIDLAAVIVAAGVVLLRHVSDQPCWIIGIAVLVVGFAFGAHAGIVASPRSRRVGIILASVVAWFVCVYALMVYYLNTFGS